MSCLTFEQMLGYVENTLPSKSRAAIEKHLAACELCSEAMEGFAAFPEKARLRPMVESLNAQIQTRYTAAAAPEVDGARATIMGSIREGLENFLTALTAPKYNLKLVYAFATVLLVGVASVLYMSRETANEKLFAEYYRPYPNIASSVRGELTGGKLQDALQQYDAGDFKAALAQLQEILAAEPENATAQFYAGVCYLKFDATEKAMISLQKVLAQQDQKLAEPAQWYLALGYVQRNDLTTAKTILNEIAAGNSFYREQAAKLLASLY